MSNCLVAIHLLCVKTLVGHGLVVVIAFLGLFTASEQNPADKLMIGTHFEQEG